MNSNLSDPYFPAKPLRHPDIALYVDFDGVLHHEAAMWHYRRGIYMSPTLAPSRTLFEWAYILEAILDEYPTVDLILSSTWCIRPGYGKALKHLPAKLRERFVGGTFHKRHHGADDWILQSFRDTPRWKQILADVERRQPHAWFALDDDIEDWPDDFLENLVACDGATGISAPEVAAELRRKLGALTQAARCQGP